MAKTDNEVKLYMKHRANKTQEIAAAKAGMTAKTGRKYEQTKLLPSQTKKERSYKTRPDPFLEHTAYIQNMYRDAPKLHAKTILKHLMETFPGSDYNMSQLRSLDRRLKPLRVLHGGNKEIYFPQELRPGVQSQSDWTHMNILNITIGGEKFKHLVFHFMLPYSCWESVDICYSESFDSLANGYQKAVAELGGVAPQHKTDNSSTATKKAVKGRDYTRRYSDLLSHYEVIAKRNNPGKGNENGSVEKSHDLFKTSVEQALLIRGSSDFASIEDYRDFLETLVKTRNVERTIKVNEEIALLNKLPTRAYEYRELMEVRVNKFSLVRIKGCSYSVPSQYVGSKLDAVVGCKEISLYYQDHLVGLVSKSDNKVEVNYRHIIDSLIKKPGAFEHYRYRECLYPHPVYKQSYELLELESSNYVKDYLQLLHLAKNHGESLVTEQIMQHLVANTLVHAIQTGEFKKQILSVADLRLPDDIATKLMPNWSPYNALLQGALVCN
jgi:hypothetical protein